ncbi:PorP/SprF family type IX secretion system membrane protein [Algoriella sp.]|uniref:PorP/SprF family type IX secretion system membrane protein n=1 Tax=Algoriella sp. TaxID=1872434 RepID=UPI001B1E67C3|nr:PorP/SprF family type IX secretion system membrane protein [Algoriella sp.]MBO6212096.1 PorP/SprF family type IX secretion system membrane protein [Algoriella sp.]
MKKFSLLVITLLSLSKVEAQQGLPFYNHYLVSDKMLINPSYAGQNPEVISISGTHRNQWDDLPDSPSTQTVSAHGIIVDRLAIGASFFNDRNGAVKMTGFGLTAAYHIPLEDREYDSEEPSVFSFGVGASNVSQRFDLSKVIAEDGSDPALNEDKYSTFFVNLGLSFKYANFFGGVSVLDIPLSQNEYYINNIEPLPTWYYFNFGYNWHLSEGIALEPSLVYNMNSSSERHLDLNLMSNISFGDNGQGVGIGVGYKQGMDSKNSNPLFVSPILKVKVGSIKAGMSYDIGLSDYQVDGRKNGFLFSLGFDLQNPWGARFD